MEFRQEGPRLGNQYLEDTALQQYMAFVLPSPTDTDELVSFGDRVVSPEYLENMRMAAQDTPWHEQFDAYGNRVDKIHTSPGWNFFKIESAKNRLIC